MSITKEEEREFLDLCRDGDIETVEYLLEHNPNLVNSSNYGMINNSVYIISHYKKKINNKWK